MKRIKVSRVGLPKPKPLFKTVFNSKRGPEKLSGIGITRLDVRISIGGHPSVDRVDLIMHLDEAGEVVALGVADKLP